jgi:membrane protease subunit HflK
MERIFSGTDKVILDTQGGGGGGVVPFLPLNEMRRQSQPQTGASR